MQFVPNRIDLIVKDLAEIEENMRPRVSKLTGLQLQAPEDERRKRLSMAQQLRQITEEPESWILELSRAVMSKQVFGSAVAAVLREKVWFVDGPGAFHKLSEGLFNSAKEKVQCLYDRFVSQGQSILPNQAASQEDEIRTLPRIDESEEGEQDERELQHAQTAEPDNASEGERPQPACSPSSRPQPAEDKPLSPEAQAILGDFKANASQLRDRFPMESSELKCYVAAVWTSANESQDLPHDDKTRLRRDIQKESSILHRDNYMESSRTCTDLAEQLWRDGCGERQDLVESPAEIGNGLGLLAQMFESQYMERAVGPAKTQVFLNFFRDVACPEMNHLMAAADASIRGVPKDEQQMAEGLQQQVRENRIDELFAARSVMEAMHDEVTSDPNFQQSHPQQPPNQQQATSSNQPHVAPAQASSQLAQAPSQEQPSQQKEQGWTGRRIGQVAIGGALTLAGLAMCIFGGPVVAFFGAVALGAGLSSGLRSALTDGGMPWGEFGKSVASGAVSGAISGGLGLAGGAMLGESAGVLARMGVGAAAGGIGGFTGTFTSRMIEDWDRFKKDFNDGTIWKDAAIAGGVGVVAGAVVGGARGCAEQQGWLKDAHAGVLVGSHVMEGAVVGGGAGALHAGLQGHDIGKGAAVGALAGGVGGLAAGGRATWQRYKQQTTGPSSAQDDENDIMPGARDDDNDITPGDRDVNDILAGGVNEEPESGASDPRSRRSSAYYSCDEQEAGANNSRGRGSTHWHDVQEPLAHEIDLEGAREQQRQMELQRPADPRVREEILEMVDSSDMTSCAQANGTQWHAAEGTFAHEPSAARKPEGPLAMKRPEGLEGPLAVEQISQDLREGESVYVQMQRVKPETGAGGDHYFRVRPTGDGQCEVIHAYQDQHRTRIEPARPIDSFVTDLGGVSDPAHHPEASQRLWGQNPKAAEHPWRIKESWVGNANPPNGDFYADVREPGSIYRTYSQAPSFDTARSSVNLGESEQVLAAALSRLPSSCPAEPREVPASRPPAPAGPVPIHMPRTVPGATQRQAERTESLAEQRSSAVERNEVPGATLRPAERTERLAEQRSTAAERNEVVQRFMLPAEVQEEQDRLELQRELRQKLQQAGYAFTDAQLAAFMTENREVVTAPIGNGHGQKEDEDQDEPVELCDYCSAQGDIPRCMRCLRGRTSRRIEMSGNVASFS